MPQLEEGYLLDHAAGTGPRAVQLLAECQAVLNREAAVRVSAAEASFGALLAGLPPASLSPSSLSAVLERTRDVEPAADAGLVGAPNRLPRVLSPYLERSGTGALDWSRRLGGIREITLDAVSDETVEASLVRLMPGGGIPDHDHGGEELTLVLEGAFHDGHALYQAGDLCSARPGLRHRPAVQGNAPCICLTVSLGAWKPVNPVYAWLDRLTRPARRRH